MEEMSNKLAALRARGDAALATLAAVRTHILRQQEGAKQLVEIIDTLLSQTDEFDKAAGISLSSNPVDNMIATLRRTMPDLAGKTDAEIKQMFGG